MKIDPKEIALQHKYCFVCSGALVYKEKGLLICTSCGYRKYISPVPCNAAILQNSKNEILLVMRKVDPKKGFWDLPGGFVDLNENAEASMVRELDEELGIKVSNLTYFTSTYDQYTYSGITFPTLCIIFTGKLGDQEITATDDVSGFKFFTASGILTENLAFESLKFVLRNFLNK